MQETKTSDENMFVTPETRTAPLLTEAEIKVPTEVYSRIVGYLRPVQNWNAGKRQEFADRKPFNLNGLQEPRAVLTAPNEVTE
jgi:hypothetical protein